MIKFILPFLFGTIILCYPSIIHAQDLIERTQQGLEKEMSSEVVPNELAKLIAQTKTTSRTKTSIANLFSVDLIEQTSFDKQMNGAVMLNIQEQALFEFWDNKATNVTFKIPTGQRSFFELELVKINLFSPGFSMSNQDGKKVEGIEKLGVFYRGIVKGDVNSIAAVSVFQNDINVFIGDNKGNYLIQKLDNRESYTLYNEQKVIKKESWSCGVNDGLINPINQEKIPITAQARNGTSTNRPIPVYIEADFQTYANAGFNVNNLFQYISVLFNNSATLFANESINIELETYSYWQVLDPYTSTSSIFEAMNIFGERIKNNFSGKLAHLVSTRSFSEASGVARIGGLYYAYTGFYYDTNGDGSNELQHYGPYGVSSFNTINEFSSIGGAALFTHEIGHNLGSLHTQACAWNGNNTPIDGCFETEGTCPRPIPYCPTNGGTIMSYCNVLAGCGINLSNGFGSQPGDVVRAGYTHFLTCLKSPMTLNLTFDDSPQDISWYIKDKNGVVLYGAGPYTNVAAGSSLTISNLFLADGEDYLFGIEDSAGDGFCTTNGSSCVSPNGFCCPNYGGEFHLTDNNGSELTILPFTTVSSSKFGIGNSTTNTTCARPAGVSTTNINNNITLAWSTVSAASTYEIQYRPVGTSNWQNITNLTSSSYFITEVLQASTTYEWYVRTRCTNGGTSEWIGSTFVTSTTAACSAPSSYGSTNTNGVINLSWNTVASVSGYQIRYRIQGTSTWSSIYSTSSSNYSPSVGLTANSTYEWQVRSVCNTLFSPWKTSNFTTSTISGASCTGYDIPVYNTITNGEYIASNEVNASCYINSGGTVMMQAGNSILLTSGFHAALGSNFTAIIASCTNATNNESIAAQSRINNSLIPKVEQELKVIPNPILNRAIVKFYIHENTPTVIKVFNLNGQALISQNQEGVAGWNTTTLDASQLPVGMYWVHLETNGQSLTKKIVVMK